MNNNQGSNAGEEIVTSRERQNENNNDDPQSFSHLAAKIWQGSQASPEASPVVRKPAASTPHGGL